MREFAEARNAMVVVAEKGTEGIAGFVIVHMECVAEGARGYVVTLDVSPDFRREGVASGLMEKAERRAQVAGARFVELHVFTENEGAIRFYERIGYVRARVRRGFYWTTGLDAFVYRKDLAPNI